jgi:hypothetical protein
MLVTDLTLALAGARLAHVDSRTISYWVILLAGLKLYGKFLDVAEKLLLAVYGVVGMIGVWTSFSDQDLLWAEKIAAWSLEI